ncbi:hypothetical protein MXD61_16310 [Frankia sp. AgPm24]|uniref:hypothetical protein n=1 Tax=Frankia sp. AgPm24 TaxID=631128 RepID=UPI00200FE339|nr:hypothetical protein [Frankia sp. AgPm24]MCK9923411.1 hypothetical protein [Frankia sp. AgPm24]
MNPTRRHPPTSPPHTLHTLTLGVLRTAVGLAALTRAVDILRLTGIDRTTATHLAWTARLAGIRDIALGAGLLTAHTTGRDTHLWITAGMLADTADVSVFATATARGHLPPALGTAMTTAALGGAAAALPLLRRHQPTTNTGE